MQQIESKKTWQTELAKAVRNVDVLIEQLQLPEKYRSPAHEAAKLFPLMVTESYLARMEIGDAHDPLLRQVLPLGEELNSKTGFVTDALDETSAHIAPGLLQKYAGRALMIATGACAIHCRYCFRRHYPYGDEPRRLDDWESAFVAIENDSTLKEVILSGGDPLMLTDERLGAIISRLESIPHVTRLRLHSRLPIVLPSRITATFLEQLTSSRLTPIMVVHANHPNEIAGDCKQTLLHLVQSGITTLNQSVLLKGVNDSAETLAKLSERLIDVGVIPYYLHQLDHVKNVSHFEVSDDVALNIIKTLRAQLPGYALPQLVREIPDEMSKMPLQ